MWSYVIIKLLLPSSVLHSVLAMLVLHSLLAVLLPVVLPSKLPKNNIHFFTSQKRLDEIEEDTSQDLIKDGSLNTMPYETENVRGSLKYYQNIPENTANDYHNSNIKEKVMRQKKLIYVCSKRSTNYKNKNK